jgi:parallel beta-helix repeat protein
VTRRGALVVAAVIAIAGALGAFILLRPRPCDGVRLRPGSDVASVVNRDNAGTTFCFAPGSYSLLETLVPQDGDRFFGADRSLLDGGDELESAFESTASDVVIRGFVIERFASPRQHAAIEAKGAEGWTIEGNEVRFNAAAGITVGSHSVARSNYVHHNAQLGIRAPDTRGTIIEANEIAYNNPEVEFNPGFDAGGAKFANTRRLVVRGNFVHDNRGNGLWFDIDNVDALIEENVIEDNEGQGIFYEISYDAVIRSNEVRGNVRVRDGEEACNLLYGAGILVAHSANVEVYDNVIEDNCNGIGGIQQDRGSGDLGPHLLENLHVHDNTIVMSRGRSGVAQSYDSAPDAFDESRNNRFVDNVYVVPDGSESWWSWEGGELTWSEWRAVGQDEGGELRES